MAHYKRPSGAVDGQVRRTLELLEVWALRVETFWRLVPGCRLRATAAGERGRRYAQLGIEVQHGLFARLDAEEQQTATRLIEAFDAGSDLAAFVVDVPDAALAAMRQTAYGALGAGSQTTDTTPGGNR